MFGVMPSVVINGIQRMRNIKNLLRRDRRINGHRHGMVDKQ